MGNDLDCEKIDLLLEKCIKEGEAADIEKFISEGGGWIRARIASTIRKLSLCSQDTDDMIQIARIEIFSLLKLKREKIMSANSPKSYIARSCVNKIITQFTRRFSRRKEKLVQDDQLALIAESKQENSCQPSSKTSENEAKIDMIIQTMLEIQGISPNLRKIITLKYLQADKLTDPQISSLTDVSVGTIEMTLVRFRKKLREILTSRGIFLPNIRISKRNGKLSK